MTRWVKEMRYGKMREMKHGLLYLMYNINYACNIKLVIENIENKVGINKIIRNGMNFITLELTVYITTMKYIT